MYLRRAVAPYCSKQDEASAIMASSYYRLPHSLPPHQLAVTKMSQKVTHRHTPKFQILLGGGNSSEHWSLMNALYLVNIFSNYYNGC